MNKTMKALVKAKPEPGLWMEQVPVPETGPNDVLVRIKKTAICGTDIHIWNWDEFTSKIVPVPMVVGHEVFGEIVEAGSAAHTVPPAPNKTKPLPVPATRLRKERRVYSASSH